MFCSHPGLLYKDSLLMLASCYIVWRTKPVINAFLCSSSSALETHWGPWKCKPTPLTWGEAFTFNKAWIILGSKLVLPGLIASSALCRAFSSVKTLGIRSAIYRHRILWLPQNGSKALSNWQSLVCTIKLLFSCFCNTEDIIIIAAPIIYSEL